MFATIHYIYQVFVYNCFYAFLALNNLCYSLADNGLKYLILDFTLLSKGSVLCNNLIELGDFDCIRICWGGRNCRLNRIVQIDAEHFVFRWPYSVSIVIYRMFISVGQVGNSFFKIDMCNKIRIEFLAQYTVLFKLLFQDLLKTPHFFNLNLAELSLALMNCMYSVLLNSAQHLLVRVICLMFWELIIQLTCGWLWVP